MEEHGGNQDRILFISSLLFSSDT